MTNFLIPYTFVGGTKAKAEEVNSNFTAIQNELTNKANLTGSQASNFDVAEATGAFHAVNKSQLEAEINTINTNLSTIENKCARNTGFKIDNGNKNSEGMPDLFNITNTTKIVFNVDDGTTFKPLKATLANEEKFELTSINDLSAATLSNGINNIFIDKNGSTIVFVNKIFKQKFQPTELVETEWTQPIITSSSENGIEITASTSDGQRDAYKALNGVKTGSDTYSGWAKFYGTANPQWWQIKFPYQLKITSISGYSRPDATPSNTATVGRFYTSSAKSKPIGDTYTNDGATSWKKATVTGIPATGIVTDTIFFEITGGSLLAGFGELEIIATKYVEGVKINDIWLDTSSRPYSTKKYNGRTFDDFNYVHLPQTVTVANGIITAKTITNGYGLNGYDEILGLPNFSKETALSINTTFTAPFDGWIKNGENMFVIYQGKTHTPNTSNYKYYPIKSI